MSKKEVIEVEATTIESELSVLPKADEWLSTVSEKAKAIASEYKPHEITSGQDYKESRQARTSARSEIQEIESERKSMTRAIEQAIKDFKLKSSEALEPLSSIDEDYKRYLDEYDAKGLALKKDAILKAYVEFAGSMVDMLSPEAMWDHFAKDHKWANKTKNLVTCIDDMQRVVEGIGKDYELINDVQCSSEDERNRLKADYFETLDLSEAMSRHKEREARVAAIEEHESYLRQLAEQQERQEQPVAQPEPEPEPVQQAEEDNDIETVEVWEVRVPESAKSQFIAAMKSVDGVHGKRVRVDYIGSN